MFQIASSYYLVTSSLFLGGKRVNICKFRPCNRHHFCRCVQLHRARSQRNHAVDQREILRLKFVDVPKKLMLSVVPAPKQKYCNKLYLILQELKLHLFLQNTHTSWRSGELKMGSPSQALKESSFEPLMQEMQQWMEPDEYKSWRHKHL